jgi:WD40 repeat protein
MARYWSYGAITAILILALMGIPPLGPVYGLQDAQAATIKIELGTNTEFKVGVYVNAIAWSPDSRYLAASDQRGHQLYVWDTDRGKLKFKVPESMGASRGLAFTSDGKFIVTSANAPARLLAFTVWNAETGQHLYDVAGPEPQSGEAPANGADILLTSPQNRYVIALPISGKSVGLYDISSWVLVSSLRVGAVRSAAVNGAGDHLAVGLFNGRVEIWKIPENIKLQDFLAEDNPFGIRPQPQHFGPLTSAYRSGDISAIAFSPDGDFLAVGSTIGAGEPREQLRLWDMHTMTPVRSYDTGNERQMISSMSYSPDGNFIATAGDPMPVRIWDAKSPSLVKEISTHGKVTPVVLFSPDGKKLAYGGEGSVHIIDFTSQH